MKTWIIALLACAMFGCQNTAEGVKEDAESNMESAAKTADESLDAFDNGKLTMAIKTAIIADDGLNDTRNMVNVDTTDGSVILTGHVHSAELRDRAAEIAKEEIDEAGVTRTIENELEIREEGPIDGS